MENETPGFFEEKDLLGLPKSKIPYGGGADPVSEEPETDEFENVPNATRFWTYVIDTICFYLFTIIIFVALAFFGMRFDGLDKVNEYLLGIFLMLIYYCLFETAAGRTPGKFIMGTKVVTVKGEHPTFTTILGRTLCRFIPFEPLSYLGGSSGGWHDSISGTRVVKVQP